MTQIFGPAFNLIPATIKVHTQCVTVYSDFEPEDVRALSDQILNGIKPYRLTYAGEYYGVAPMVVRKWLLDPCMPLKTIAILSQAIYEANKRLRIELDETF